MQNLLSSSVFSGFDSLVEELGGDAHSLLEQFLIPVDVTERSDGYVSFFNASLLFEHCASSLACPDFGIRLAQRQGLSILGPIAVLAKNATTIDTAVRSIADYFHLITPAIKVNFELLLAQSCVRVYFAIVEPGLYQTRQMYELCLGNGQIITQLLAGGDVKANKICFPHARFASVATYRDFFSCPVSFEQAECTADLPLTLMRHEVLGADKETANIAAAYLAERYGGKVGQLSEQVNHLIGRLLPVGHCKINIIAEHLGMHTRTLQRRLSEQSLVFEELVDDQRKELASRYLAESNLRLTQVAGLLGYADQSALNRSCRRWFGMTPKQLRQQAVLKS